MGSLRKLLDSHSEEEKLAVWEKGQPVIGADPSEFRKDSCGAWIQFSAYNDTSSDTSFGWEIDHITSHDHGGQDILSNFRPLQWFNNRNKGAGRLKCPVTAEGDYNILRGDR